MSLEDGMLDSPLESPIGSPSPEDRHKCESCHERMKQPVVLACLHVFCLPCLEKQVEEKTSDEAPCEIVECETCHHETPIPEKGLSELPPEYVLMDLIEIADIESKMLICTSCKAKEKAHARCQDCASFLCSNCVTAHKFMRCFDNHKVVTIEEMLEGDSTAVHRPIFCVTHPSECLKNYCKTCEIPICNECYVGDHKPPEHQPERVEEMEEKEREYLKKLIAEGKNKIVFCEESSNKLMSSLGELQSQTDNAKDLINETFQSYKAMLEKQKDDMLAELDTLQSGKELALMELCHNFGKTSENLEMGCQFTEHVLNNGTVLHLLLMKKVITSRLMSLVSSAPEPDVDVDIEFKTDHDEFEKTLKKTFGHFKKEEEEDIKLPERPSSSLHSSFENEAGFNIHQGVSPDTTIMPSMQGNFIGLPPVSTPGPSAFGGFNFQGLTNVSNNPLPIGRSKSTIESRSISRNSHSPAMSDSGISVDAGSTNSNSSAPLSNIAMLAKLGTSGYNSQNMGRVGAFSDLISPPADSSPVQFQTGQGITGLMNFSVMGQQPIGQQPIGQQPSRGTTPMSEVGTIGPPPIQRPTTPSLEQLAGLLDRNSSSLDNFPFDQAVGGSFSPTPGTATPTFSANSTLSDSSSSMNTVCSSQSGMSSGPPVRRSQKMSAMQIRCKFGQLGPGKGQFNSPHGFCLGHEEDITVADTNNHRVQIFEKTGEFKYQFGIPGREEGQLWYPRKVAVMRNSGKFIVCDRGNERSRMQIFTKNGHFTRKISIRYIDIVAGLAISSQGHIVAVDSVSPTVFVISEGGELIKWFDCSDYMREPSDIAISGKEYFVCDFKGHCVVVFNEEGHFMRRIGCENITNYPNGIDISDAGDVLVGDSHGNRFHVAVFQRDGSLIGEFECPYVKVSRCCGLKITGEGYVVTLAKNNHHVLVLNTLYIS